MKCLVNTKTGCFLSTLILAVILFLAAPLTASAALYIELDNSDGDTTFDFWLRTGGATLIVDQMDIIFAYDPTELQFSGGYTENLPDGWYNYDPSAPDESFGEGTLHVQYQNWSQFPVGQDTLLATLTFDLLPGATIDGESDLWFLPNPDQFTAQVMMGYVAYQVEDLLAQGYAGYGAGLDAGDPVPVPGAVWLLGSGLLGLVGIRRKNRIR